MDTFRMDGYRQWLEKAIRVEDDDAKNNKYDWSVHTIDYAGFKRKLRYFSKRRSRLRNLLATSTNDSILASDLDDILGLPPTLPNGGNDNDIGGGGMLLPTPRAHGRTTSNLMEILTGNRKGTTTSVVTIEQGQSQEQSQLQSAYVPFTDDDEEDITKTRTKEDGPGMIPLHIETMTSHQSEKSFFWGGTGGDSPPRVQRQAVMRQVSNYERNDVMIFLALELDKVFMFYLSQWQSISQQLLDYQNSVVDLMQQQLGSVTSKSNRLADPTLQKIGKELLELEAFVVINLVTVRQSLIRYDAFVRTLEGTPMLDYYMKCMASNNNTMVGSMGSGDSKNGAALSQSFRKLLQHVELDALSETYLPLCSEDLQRTFLQQREEFAYVLDCSEQAQAVASSGHTSGNLKDTFLHTLRHYFLLGMMEDRLGYEPTYLISRGASLSKEMQIMASWRTRKKRGSNKNNNDYFVDDEDEEESLGYHQIFNLVMALLAAFLYCMNYYIVEPSSTMYVNALGGQDALSGALIGMMPMASFISAIAYSIWTNYSFRHPFLVSCLLMLLGNLLYSYAYESKSLIMAFCGRFLTGLGGPKCIVRRYMADTTSLSIRTSVNAGFGMVVAAGSAFGPGCAILINRWNFQIPLPGGAQDNGLFVNGMTGPGYLMALLWFVFTCALCYDFQEPDRKGLEEQKRLELLQTKDDAKAYKYKDGNDGAADDYSSTSRNGPSSNDSVGSETPAGGGGGGNNYNNNNSNSNNDDLNTLYSGATSNSSYQGEDGFHLEEDDAWWDRISNFLQLVTFPVRLCLGLLFAKVFVIETLVSATSTLSKNRYQWRVHEVGILGCVNGLFVIPLSILVGRLSMTYQDRALMTLLLGMGLVGLLLLIDITDLVNDDSSHYNDDNFFAVGPRRYVLGYFIVYVSIQSFEGVIGSALSKLIPTALASGTINSGLLATLVDTFGRTCGDLFICLCGFIDLRQLMNLLFIPGALLLSICLWVVRKHYDLLAV